MTIGASRLTGRLTETSSSSTTPRTPGEPPRGHLQNRRNPGDGIGKETVPESLKVLDAVARRFDFSLDFAHYEMFP